MIIYGLDIYFHNMQKVTRKGKFSLMVFGTYRLYRSNSVDFETMAAYLKTVIDLINLVCNIKYSYG